MTITNITEDGHIEGASWGTPVLDDLDEQPEYSCPNCHKDHYTGHDLAEYAYRQTQQ